MSTVLATLESVKSAVETLAGRVKVMLAFLRATQRSEVPMNHQLLRQVNAIISMLPAVTSSDFSNEFFSVSPHLPARVLPVVC